MSVDPFIGVPVELQIYLVAVAFAIRDMNEYLTYSIICDLAILNPKIRKYLHDLTRYTTVESLIILNYNMILFEINKIIF